MMKYNNLKYIALLLLVVASSCEPYQSDEIDIGDAPAAPAFIYEILADNPNKVLVTDLSSGSFNRLWEFSGGTPVPGTSSEVSDTVLFTKAGTHTITLHIAASNGGGTAQSSQTVTIEEDAVIECSTELEYLLGGCSDGDTKCWTFSQVAGAVIVGPIPGSSEWFSSPVSGLQAEQYDDKFCFSFEESGFLYQNNGLTVDPWNGFTPVPFDPPTDLSWQYSLGSGENGADQIVLPEGAFMGVWNSGPVYDIVVLSSSEMILRSPISDSDGWFDLTFIVAP